MTDVRPLRVLYFNDYAMDVALARWRAGEIPAQHLYGTHDLERFGFEVDVLPWMRHRRLKRWSKKRVGDLDQQVRALLRRDVDVIYSGSQFDTTALAILRRVGVLRRPLVATIHHRPAGKLRHPLLFRFLYGGHDRLLCLGEAARRDLVEQLGLSPDRVRWQGWTVDLPYYDRHREEEPAARTTFVLAAGKTKRDYDTLVRAVQGTTIAVRVRCSAQSAPSVRAPNVEVVFDDDAPNRAEALPADTLLGEYRAAHAVAIPLAATTAGTSTGLTSLVEAMAMGKAVVMTRNDWLDVDIELEGAGFVVDPGDAEGWRRALGRLAEDPELTLAMGRRARELCEERFSPTAHAARLASELHAVVMRSGR